MKPKTLKELKEYINSIDMPDETPVVTLDLTYDNEKASIDDADFDIEEMERLDEYGEPNGQKEKVLLISVKSFEDI